MNSRSEASRPPVFDIIAAIGVIVALVLVSGFLRSRFPTPPGYVWWLATAVGIWGSYKASVGRRKSAVRGALIFSGIYLTIQIVVQALIAFGIVSF